MSDSLFCSQKNWRFAGKTKELIPNTEYIHIYTHTPTHTHPHTHTVYIIKLLKKALKAYSNYDYMYVQGDSGGPLYMSEFHPTTNLTVPGGKW